MPEPLPPGIDEDLIEEGAVLTCIGIPEGEIDIDLIPPLWGEILELDIPLSVVLVNIVGISIAVWFLRSRLKAKLAEVEARQSRNRED